MRIIIGTRRPAALTCKYLRVLDGYVDSALSNAQVTSCSLATTFFTRSTGAYKSRDRDHGGLTISLCLLLMEDAREWEQVKKKGSNTNHPTMAKVCIYGVGFQLTNWILQLAGNEKASIIH